MKVAIYGRGLEADQHAQVFALLTELQHQLIDTMVYSGLAMLHEEIFSPYSGEQLFETTADLEAAGVTCLISLGGDGTLLDTVTLVKDTQIPILGINFGRLGFLASLGKDELIHAVDALVSGTYVTDKRALIHLDANMPLFGDIPFALNEFAIHKRDTSSMIKIHTYLNGEFLNTYWADGLIVSTPTGSTGYNMSCNGPIIFPESDSFVITPVAPHNLNVRPIVIPNDTIVSFEVEGRMDEFICTLDSRKEIVPRDVQLAIKKELFDVKLIRLNENSFLSTLRNKLTWGLDKRN